MAYVRKTDTLVEDIKSHVRKMKDKALSNFASNSIEYGTPLFDAAAEAAVNAAFRDAPDLKGKLPQSWCKKHERVELQFVTEDGDHNFKTSITAPEHKQIELPPNVENRYYAVEVNVRRSDCPELLKTWLDEANDRNLQRGVIAEQYSTVEDQLSSFMSQHASLNAAVREMPEIEMYVPANHMAKLRQPTEPRGKKTSRSSAVEDLGIDRNALASMAIAHRITS